MERDHDLHLDYTNQNDNEAIFKRLACLNAKPCRDLDFEDLTMYNLTRLISKASPKEE